ncbi:MAG: hypothetical protein JXX14_04170 [Deltaproteobacteria bacterium]|nr:hypothetical protein [Deltaproteobacteria bacterium]
MADTRSPKLGKLSQQRRLPGVSQNESARRIGNAIGQHLETTIGLIKSKGSDKKSPFENRQLKMGMTVVAVITVFAGLLWHHQQTQASEILARYAQRLANVGSGMEAEVTHISDVFDNLLPAQKELKSWQPTSDAEGPLAKNENSCTEADSAVKSVCNQVVSDYGALYQRPLLRCLQHHQNETDVRACLMLYALRGAIWSGKTDSHSPRPETRLSKKARKAEDVVHKNDTPDEDWNGKENENETGNNNKPNSPAPNLCPSLNNPALPPGRETTKGIFEESLCSKITKRVNDSPKSDFSEKITNVLGTIILKCAQKMSDGDNAMMAAETDFSECLFEETLNLNCADKNELNFASPKKCRPYPVEFGKLREHINRNFIFSYRESLEECVDTHTSDIKAAFTCVVRRALKMSRVTSTSVTVEEQTTSTAPRDDSYMRISNDKNFLEFQFGQLSVGKLKLAELLPQNLSSTLSSELSGAFNSMILFDVNGVALTPHAANKIRMNALPDKIRSDAAISSVFRNFEINGKKYAIFLQPVGIDVNPISDNSPNTVTLAANETETETTGTEQTPGRVSDADSNDAIQPRKGLLLCGILAEDQLSAESFQFPPNMLLFIALLTSIAILAIPISKLWWLGPTSRFTRFDTIMLKTSAFLLMLVSVLIFWSVVFNSAYQKRTDMEMEAVQESKKSGFNYKLHQRVEEGVEALNEFIKSTETLRDELMTTTPDQIDITLKSPSTRREPPSNRQMTQTKCEEMDGHISIWKNYREPGWENVPICEMTSRCGLTGKFKVCDPKNQERPNWTQAFWTDHTGHQRLKITSEAHATQPVALESREYFQRVIRNQTVQLPAKTNDGASSNGFADIIVSITNNDTRIMISKRTSPTEHSPDGGVAAISMKVEDLLQPPLPRGVSLMVVNRSGKIILHSEDNVLFNRTLHEILSNRDSRLIMAAMNARKGLSEHIKIMGEPMRILARPVPQMDWYVVTMTPRSFIYGPVYDTMLISLAGYGIYIFIVSILLTVIIAQLKRPKRLLQAIRPHKDFATTYRNVGIWSISLATVITVTSILRPNHPRLIFLIICTVLIVLSVSVMKRNIYNQLTERWQTGKTRLLLRGALDKLMTFKIFRPFKRIGQRVGTKRTVNPAGSGFQTSYFLWWLGVLSTLVFAPATVIHTGIENVIAQNNAMADLSYFTQKLTYALAADTSDKPPALYSHATKFEKEEKSAEKNSPEKNSENKDSQPTAASWVRGMDTYAIKHLFEAIQPLRGRRDDEGWQFFKLKEYADSDVPHSNKRPHLQQTVKQTADTVVVSPMSAAGNSVLTTQKSTLAHLSQFLSPFLAVFFLCTVLFYCLMGGAAFVCLIRLYSMNVLTSLWRTSTRFDEVIDMIRKQATDRKAGDEKSPRQPILLLIANVDLAEEQQSQKELLIINALREQTPSEPPPVVEWLPSPLPWQEKNDHSYRQTRRRTDAMLQKIKIAKNSQRDIVLLCNRHILRTLDTEKERAQWAECLFHFQEVRLGFSGECVVDRSLEERQPLLLPHGKTQSYRPEPKVSDLSRSQVPSNNGSDGEYTFAQLCALWNRCDSAQRMLLYKLTFDDILPPHPDNSETIKDCVASRILCPHRLDFTSEEIRQFVEHQINEDVMQKLNADKSDSIWNTIKAPLYTAVGLVVTALLFVFQDTEMAAASAAAPTVAITLPIVLKILSNSVLKNSN